MKSLLKELFNRNLIRRKKDSVVYYYAFFVTSSIILTYIFLIVMVFQRFFPLFGILFITVFTLSTVTSTDSYLLIIENGIRVTAASFIGCVSAVIVYGIVGNSIWPAVFPHFVLCFVASGLMISKDVEWIPFQHGKRIFLDFFVLTYTLEPSTHSYTLFLRFFLTTLCMLGCIIFSCLIFNPYFGSTLFIRTASKIIRKSRKMFEKVGSQLSIAGQIKSTDTINITMYNMDWLLNPKRYKKDVTYMAERYSIRLNILYKKYHTTNIDNDSIENQLSINSNPVMPSLERLDKMPSDYLQFLVLSWFEKISDSMTQILDKYSELMVNPDYCYNGKDPKSLTKIDKELSRIHFFIIGMVNFTEDLKRMSVVIYDITNHPLEKPRILIAFRSIFAAFYDYFKVFFQRNRKLFSGKGARYKDYPFPDLLSSLSYPWQQRIYMVFEPMGRRIFSDWRFSLRFSVGVTTLSVAYYETFKHSHFILFRNLQWLVITFTFVMSPTVGASGSFAVMRFVGTLVASFVAYGGAVLFTLPHNYVARSIIFIFNSIVIFFSISAFLKYNYFQTTFNFFALTYFTLSFPMLVNGKANIINCLLRTFHITMAIVVVLLFSNLFLPSYDYDKLEQALCVITADAQKIFSQIIYFNLKIKHTGDRKKGKQQIVTSLQQLRAKIAGQRELLFNVKLELILNQEKYLKYRHLLKLAAKLYRDLVSLELISKSSSSILLSHVKESGAEDQIILLMGEMDSTGQYLRELGIQKKTIKIHGLDRSLEIDKNLKRTILQGSFNNNYPNGPITPSLIALSATIYASTSFIKNFDSARQSIWELKGVEPLKRVDSNVIGTAQM
ncbi:hypothetical protein PPL_08625 [Heterostelium album PN500]|uniref:Integral membrane bound transporter domain-containing protein n=1 Tax=Heterostelium pallidum (strain ATCC 26659 / Pp 5 / PN500) TaxID=670386 RepID=D3BJA0_HETP5|nr:hypothetical protein PPL_08625 [Heterostelium album PN500]EFA77980.1 hypothetical protein PPL_08625 [Heterostelium album PN500]|eukprot:XP_020430108.1 hypothetical protein PPL_08625 [Heterostelium album PN500]